METNSTPGRLQLLEPKKITNLIQNGMCDGINSIVFCTIEGSPIAQVRKEGYRNTKSALIANIFYEYMDLGTQAFSDNNLENIIFEVEDEIILAKNIYNHILWFTCEDKSRVGGKNNRGLIMAKLESLGNALLKLLEPLKDTFYKIHSEAVNVGDEGEQDEE